MPPEAFEYFSVTTPPRVIRREKMGGVAELTAAGWREAPRMGKLVSEHPAADVEKLDRRTRQRLNDTALDAEADPSSAWSMTYRRAKQWVVPPLEYGAPRHFGDSSRQDLGEAAYDEQLPSELDEALMAELLEEAKDGYERQGVRVQGIEHRAGIYQGGASISGGLVLTGTALLSGNDRVPDGVLRWIIFAGLVSVSLSLVLSGWRAHQASVYSFSWARPNIRRKILRRATEPNVAAVQRNLLAALLLAQDRGQIIAHWKLARLKQAARYFVAAVLASFAVSVMFVLHVVFGT